ncbi:hypothetical protein FA15DRAFT_659283 [Coprinopsis marcescibilis]|uniref:DUF6699 domain-containing protein n=1 Tax=Coprinopsis marcescibilis TaxID=230819 RepID=A0A5C3KIT4_COPMA|nr:hypothetical protein FA15DRAFT_659283 [Coprinopsis marcescibilis]
MHRAFAEIVDLKSAKLCTTFSGGLGGIYPRRTGSIKRVINSFHHHDEDEMLAATVKGLVPAMINQSAMGNIQGHIKHHPFTAERTRLISNTISPRAVSLSGTLSLSQSPHIVWDVRCPPGSARRNETPGSPWILHNHWFYEPATNPGVDSLTIRMGILQDTPVVVFPADRGDIVRVLDVLRFVHDAVQRRISAGSAFGADSHNVTADTVLNVFDNNWPGNRTPPLGDNVGWRWAGLMNSLDEPDVWVLVTLCM